jgi:hypothetical protein
MKIFKIRLKIYSFNSEEQKCNSKPNKKALTLNIGKYKHKEQGLNKISSI